MKDKGISNTEIIIHIFKRTAVLFILGMLSKGLLSEFNVKFVSVLSRIGFSYFVCAVLALYTGWRFQAALTAIILAISWPAMMLIPVPQLGGHVYLMPDVAKQIPVMSQTVIWIMSIPSTLLGSLAGYWLFSQRSGGYKAGRLAVAGLCCTILGCVWGLAYPRIFSLWTGSFVMFMAGNAMMLMAAFYYIIDVKNYRRWCIFFVIIGANAIFIYFLRVSSMIDFDKISQFFTGGICSYSGRFAETVHALGVLGVLWGINAFLYKHKIFIKA